MPKRGSLKSAGKRQESATFLATQLLQCRTAVFRLLQCSFLVHMASALQKSQCCSATSAAQQSENCSATSVFACGLSGPVLRDTARLSQRYPPIARYGVFGVSTWPIGCDTPSLFSERLPLEEHAKWRCETPTEGVSQRYLHENKANGCNTPLCDTISKGYCAIWGGMSHWAVFACGMLQGWGLEGWGLGLADSEFCPTEAGTIRRQMTSIKRSP